MSMSQHLRGTPAPDVKAAEDMHAIGGLRDAERSVSRLSFVSSFGRSLGRRIQTALLEQHIQCRKGGKVKASWIDSACDKMANDDPGFIIPREGIECIKSIITKACGHTPKQYHESDVSTDIDHGLLEAWRKAASDPDTAVCSWLEHGAPAGILTEPEPCGIFPSPMTLGNSTRKMCPQIIPVFATMLE